MKKITLESIFDSLDSDSLDEAKAKLHTWLVGEGKRIHAELNGIVVESEEEEETDEVSESILSEEGDEYVVEVSYELNDQAENFQDHIETVLQQKAVDVDHVGEAVYLVFHVNGSDHAEEVERDIQGLTGEIPGLQAHSKPASLYHESDEGSDDERIDELSRDAINKYAEKSREDLERSRRQVAAAAERKGISPDEEYDSPGASGQFKRQMKRYSGLDDADYKLNGKAHVPATEEEEQLDELSRDTMKAYAKAARKDRDSDMSSDEKVGRRVAGLNLVSDKARREKAALQYEDQDRVDELSTDTMKSYAKAARKDRDSNVSSDEKVGRRVAGLSMVADKARRDKAKLQYESEEDADSEALEEADLIADLAEAFAGLKTVSHKQTKDGEEVGDAGKVKTNTKSSLPMKKKDKREGGDPVEIKSDDHNGFSLETAPKVKDAPKKEVENAKKDPKKVNVKGGKALLNKKDGFGSDSPDSPISGKGL